MKAAVYDEYGPPEVVRLAELDEPAPAANELLVKVRATTVAAGDWRMRKADPLLARLYNGLFKPRRVRVLGFELAGEVEAVGSAVRRFKPGEHVFAFTGFGFGAHAEYRCLAESGEIMKVGLVAHKPANLSFEQAAAVPVGGLTAQGFLRRAGVRPGERVLVYGASGSVGTFAVQLARYLGAQVTGVCSAANVALVRSLGADEVIDYTSEDFTQRGRVFDVVFDAVGRCAASRSRRVLKRGGRRVSVTGSPQLRPGDLERLQELIEEGKLTPVIDRRYPLEQIVDAHRYVEAGHKKGNVVLIVSQGGRAPER